MTLSSAIKPRIELPATALQEVDGKLRIWVIDTQSKTVSPRDVSVISRTDSSVVLAGGVKNGERVVSAGVNSLKPGQSVKLDEDSQ
ncbi:multidrug efflux system subunit MdtA [compost metagenome]